jgi:hypothetical protein
MHINTYILYHSMPALGIPKCMAREAIKKWTEHQHLRTWKDMPGCTYSKLFVSRLCKKRADDLLKPDDSISVTPGDIDTLTSSGSI